MLRNLTVIVKVPGSVGFHDYFVSPVICNRLMGTKLNEWL